MKQNIYLLITLFLAACGASSSDNNKDSVLSNKIDSNADRQSKLSMENTREDDSLNYNYATFYVVVADTGSDYYALNKEMYSINKHLKIPIDTLGRYYNKAKNLITLPDNDEDENDAGDYLPRRYPSESLSLEYLVLFDSEAGEKTIALVAGIYEKEESADKALTNLQKANSRAFKLKSKVYVGCMH